MMAKREDVHAAHEWFRSLGRAVDVTVILLVAVGLGFCLWQFATLGKAGTMGALSQAAKSATKQITRLIN